MQRNVHVNNALSVNLYKKLFKSINCKSFLLAAARMTRISVEELLNESASDTEERRMTATMTLVFVTVSDNCKYSRQWSINSVTATKLTLKEFMRFMVSLLQV